MIKNERIIDKKSPFDFLSSCSNCKNKYKNEPGCKAFDVIPNEILSGENKHTKPLEDQSNDIVFEKAVNYVL